MVKDTVKQAGPASVSGCKFIGIYEKMSVKTYFTRKREQFRRFFVSLH